VLFYVVAIVGLRWLSTAAAAGPSALVIWAIAGVGLFLPLAYATMELAARHPEEGGIYVWTRHAFGDFAAFMGAWLYWVSNLVYLPGLLYFMAGNVLFLGGAGTRALSNEPMLYVLVSALGVTLGIALNTVGLSIGKRLHNLGGQCMWLTVAVLVAMGAIALARFGSVTDFGPASLRPSVRLADIYFWTTIAFAFSGFEAASLMGEEIRDAPRTVPRAVVVAGLVIVAVYMLGTAALLVALPARQVGDIAGILQAIEAVSVRVGVPWMVPLAAVLVAVGALGGTSAWLAATARLIVVPGVDRDLPPVFGRIHPKWGTPVAALVVQGIGAVLFALLGQMGASVRTAYDFLVSMGVITYFIPYLLMFGALLKAQGEPLPEGAVRAPGGSPMAVLMSCLGIVTLAISIALALFPPGGGSAAAIKVIAATVVVVLVGIGLYVRARRAWPINAGRVE
jgi:amino acid transporter